MLIAPRHQAVDALGSLEGPCRSYLLKNIGSVFHMDFGMVSALRSVTGRMYMTTQELLHATETSTEAEFDLAYSMYLLKLDPTLALSVVIQEGSSGNPILSLDSSPRIAFVLHHLLGYKIEDAALLVEISEQEFRAQLRDAYVQLAVSCQFGDAIVLGEPALA